MHSSGHGVVIDENPKSLKKLGSVDSVMLSIQHLKESKIIVGWCQEVLGKDRQSKNNLLKIATMRSQPKHATKHFTNLMLRLLCLKLC